jgi:hypothetical protein
VKYILKQKYIARGGEEMKLKRGREFDFVCLAFSAVEVRAP